MPGNKKSKIHENGTSSVQNSPQESSGSEPFCPTNEFIEAWSHCSLKGFIGNAGNEKKNSTVIMMNLTSIPCCVEKCRDNDKVTALKLAVIHIQAPGFSKAPYTLPFGGGKGKLGEDAKPLSVICDVPAISGDSEIVKGLRLWPFKKEAVPGSRGPRYEDKSFIMQGGDVYITFVSAKDFIKSNNDKGQSLFPEDMDEIPAFTMLEVEVSSKIGDPQINKEGQLAQRTSNIRMMQMKVHKYSLYSYDDVFVNFAPSLESARHWALTKQEKNPIISRDIETSDVVFYLKTVSRDAVLSIHNVEEFGMVSVTSWSDDPMDNSKDIDVPVDILLKYTNSTKLQWATTLLEIAINMQCVSFLVVHSDYFRKGDILSNYRAIPIIDTMKMFSAVKFNNGYTPLQEQRGDDRAYTFDTQKCYKDPSGNEHPLTITVFQKANYVETEGPLLPTSDFIILDGRCEASKTILFSFNQGVNAPGQSVQPVLYGYLRVGGKPKAGGAIKRPQFGCIDI